MIYISTGGFKDLLPEKSIKILNKKNIDCIELSGGQYSKKISNNIIKNKNNIFAIHNYFPVPKKSFVLNLASNNNLSIFNLLSRSVSSVCAALIAKLAALSAALI